jgi:hypothetical protein
MKKLIHLFYLLTAILFFACNKTDFHNTDDKVGISRVTHFPIFNMSGDKYMSVVLGSTYTEPGVTATEGSADIPVTTSGTVDVNTVGVYTISYSATNKDGFSNSIKRTIAVIPSAEVPGTDISGKYANVGSFSYVATIQKLAPGFYVSDNVWGGSSSAVVASYLITSDGTNIILPLNSISPYGQVDGTGTLDNTGNLILSVSLIDYGISNSIRNWKKQ